MCCAWVGAVVCLQNSWLFGCFSYFLSHLFFFCISPLVLHQFGIRAEPALYDFLYLPFNIFLLFILSLVSLFSIKKKNLWVITSFSLLHFYLPFFSLFSVNQTRKEKREREGKEVRRSRRRHFSNRRHLTPLTVAPSLSPLISVVSLERKKEKLRYNPLFICRLEEDEEVVS